MLTKNQCIEQRRIFFEKVGERVKKFGVSWRSKGGSAGSAGIAKSYADLRARTGALGSYVNVDVADGVEKRTFYNLTLIEIYDMIREVEEPLLHEYPNTQHKFYMDLDYADEVYTGTEQSDRDNFTNYVIEVALEQLNERLVRKESIPLGNGDVRVLDSSKQGVKDSKHLIFNVDINRTGCVALVSTIVDKIKNMLAECEDEEDRRVGELLLTKVDVGVYTFKEDSTPHALRTAYSYKSSADRRCLLPITNIGEVEYMGIVGGDKNDEGFMAHLETCLVNCCSTRSIYVEPKDNYKSTSLTDTQHQIIYETLTNCTHPTYIQLLEDFKLTKLTADGSECRLDRKAVGVEKRCAICGRSHSNDNCRLGLWGGKVVISCPGLSHHGTGDRIRIPCRGNIEEEVVEHDQFVVPSALATRTMAMPSFLTSTHVTTEIPFLPNTQEHVTHVMQEVMAPKQVQSFPIVEAEVKKSLSTIEVCVREKFNRYNSTLKDKPVYNECCYSKHYYKIVNRTDKVTGVSKLVNLGIPSPLTAKGSLYHADKYVERSAKHITTTNNVIEDSYDEDSYVDEERAPALDVEELLKPVSTHRDVKTPTEFIRPPAGTASTLYMSLDKIEEIFKSASYTDAAIKNKTKPYACTHVSIQVIKNLIELLNVHGKYSHNASLLIYKYTAEYYNDIVLESDLSSSFREAIVGFRRSMNRGLERLRSLYSILKSHPTITDYVEVLTYKNSDSDVQVFNNYTTHDMTILHNMIYYFKTYGIIDKPAASEYLKKLIVDITVVDIKVPNEYHMVTSDDKGYLSMDQYTLENVPLVDKYTMTISKIVSKLITDALEDVKYAGIVFNPILPSVKALTGVSMKRYANFFMKPQLIRNSHDADIDRYGRVVTNGKVTYTESIKDYVDRMIHGKQSRIFSWMFTALDTDCDINEENKRDHVMLKVIVGFFNQMLNMSEPCQKAFAVYCSIQCSGKTTLMAALPTAVYGSNYVLGTPNVYDILGDTTTGQKFNAKLLHKLVACIDDAPCTSRRVAKDINVLSKNFVRESQKNITAKGKDSICVNQPMFLTRTTNYQSDIYVEKTETSLIVTSVSRTDDTMPGERAHCQNIIKGIADNGKQQHDFKDLERCLQMIYNATEDLDVMKYLTDRGRADNYISTHQQGCIATSVDPMGIFVEQLLLFSEYNYILHDLVPMRTKCRSHIHYVNEFGTRVLPILGVDMSTIDVYEFYKSWFNNCYMNNGSIKSVPLIQTAFEIALGAHIIDARGEKGNTKIIMQTGAIYKIKSGTIKFRTAVSPELITSKQFVLGLKQSGDQAYKTSLEEYIRYASGLIAEIVMRRHEESPLELVSNNNQ